MPISQINYQVYAIAYAVTEDSGTYTPIYSSYLTVVNPMITYSLRNNTEHFEERSALVAHFMVDFNACSGSSATPIVDGEIYTAGDDRQQAFWSSSTMLTKWNWLLEHFLPFRVDTNITTMSGNILHKVIPTPYIPLLQYLQGFLKETNFCPSGSTYLSIDFIILSNAYHYGNVEVHSSALYDGGFLTTTTPYKVGYAFSHWSDSAGNKVITPI